jgi:hypothetical protein
METKVQYDRKFTESRQGQHNNKTKCPHIYFKSVRVLALILNESNILF